MAPISQRVGPDGFTDAGTQWQEFADAAGDALYFYIGGHELTVQLDNSGDRFSMADAVRIDLILFDLSPQVAHGAAADVILANVVHRYRGHDAGVDADAFQRILQGQRVHYRGQHAHVITGYPVDARLRQPGAAKDVAAADDDGYFYAETADFGDLGSDPVNDRRIDSVILPAQQRLAAELEEDPFIAVFSHR